MKRNYIVPEIETIGMTTKDIITISAGEDGVMSSYSFNEIINGSAGWIEAN